MSDLADQVARLPGFALESGGDAFGPCPLSCGSVVNVTTEGEVMCGGGCPEKAVAAALRLRVGVIQPCPHAKESMHRSEGFCPACDLYSQHGRRLNRDHLDQLEEERANLSASTMRVSGEALLDMEPVSQIWGFAHAPLSAEGQALMIVGPDGTGKTSTAGQYAKVRLGLLPLMWDLPVKPLPPERSVYYFAADRPRQAMEAFKRGLSEEHRELLRHRLSIHKGPPPYRLTGERGQAWLLNEVEETRAGLVIFDSRKDFGATTNADEVAGFNTAVQLLVASDVEVLILHHPNETRRNGPPTLSAISGHGAVYSGMGSVLFLDGKPGSTLVVVHHLKPIRTLLPRFHIAHDHETGCSEVLLLADNEEAEGRRLPVNGIQRRVLACIDAHPTGEASAKAIKAVVSDDNLTRALEAAQGRWGGGA